MNPIKGLGMVVVTLGIIGLAYGGFSYTRESSAAQLGPIELTVKDTRTVNIPVWAGVAAIVVGAGLLMVPNKMRS